MRELSLSSGDNAREWNKGNTREQENGEVLRKENKNAKTLGSKATQQSIPPPPCSFVTLRFFVLVFRFCDINP